MASSRPSNSSIPNDHFLTLLERRQLYKGLTFKPVEIQHVNFGENGVKTSNFIEKVMELSQTKSVKNSGGFMILRPTQGVNIFTQPKNSEKNDFDNVWNAVPSLQSFKECEVLSQRQKANNWKVPLFGYDSLHKKAVRERQIFNANQSKSNKNDKNNKEVHKEMNNPLTIYSTQKNEKKRKNEQNTNNFQPFKRQKIETRNPSPSLLSYSNSNNNSSKNEKSETNQLKDTHYSHKNLSFYRGFCCMTHKADSYKKCKFEPYVNDIAIKNNNTESEYNDNQSIEDKMLILLRYLYEGNAAMYGHIDAMRENDATCYAQDSPFKASELKNYGPFSCLNEEEWTAGIQTPYIYIGDRHTFFPWHSEDMHFHAMNHLLFGANKIWFCIQPTDYKKVLTFFGKQFKHYYPDCLTPLQHKNTLMDPYIFSSLGITVFYVVQRPGDIVVAPPGGLHCGLNESFNLAESVNFMTFADTQWIYSLSAMLIKSYNLHDCCAKSDVVNIPCICCQSHCTSPDERFECDCKICDCLKCACDYHIYLDINILAERVRKKYGNEIGPNYKIVPKFMVKNVSNEQVNDSDDCLYWNVAKHGYEFRMYHARKMSAAEVDKRWINPPKCNKEWIYPVRDAKDHKFYPAICYNNRIIKKCELLLTYQYQMDFIAFGDYFQICNESEIVTPGGITSDEWSNPPFAKQHGFYKTNVGKNENQKNENKHKLFVGKLKGTPSFDFLRIELNEESPLIGTEWEQREITFAYPPGARKYNLQIRANKIERRKASERDIKLQQLTSINVQNTEYHSSASSAIYQLDEYKDTESSSSSNSEEREMQMIEESSADFSMNDDDEDEESWEPEGSKWTQSLPEYQYSGLRTSKRKKSQKQKSSNHKKMQLPKIKKHKRKKKKKKKKEKKLSKKKKKSKKRKRDDLTSDSENDCIIPSASKRKRAKYDSEETQNGQISRSDDEHTKKKRKKRKSKSVLKKKKKRKNEELIQASSSLIGDQSLNYANCPIPLPKMPDIGSLGPAQRPLVQYNQANITQNIYNNINPQTMNNAEALNQFALDLVNKTLHSQNLPSLGLPNLSSVNDGNQSNASLLFSKQKEREKQRKS